MKLLSLGCALILFIAQSVNAAHVHKSKNLNLDIYGDLGIALYFGDQEKADGNAGEPALTQIRADGIIGFDANVILPNSYKVGLVTEIEAFTEIETAYLYFAGPFGKFRIGQDDNVSSYLHLTIPEFLAPGLATIEWSDYNFNPRTSVTGEDDLQFGDTTYLTYDDVALQVSYLSPPIQGFQFGMSWTPDPCNNLLEEDKLSLIGSSPNCLNEANDGYIVNNVITAGVQFGRIEGDLRWGLSANYMSGNGSSKGNLPYGYSFGLNVTYLGFQFGGAWQNNSNFNAPEIADKTWIIGLAYHQDNWRVGTAYRRSRRKFQSGSEMKMNEEVELGLAYELGAGFWTSLFFEYVKDEDPEENNRTIDSVGGGIIFSYAF